MITAQEGHQSLPAVAPDATLRYGQDANQLVDGYLPQGTAPYPVVILVHGGCWRAQYNAKPLAGRASRSSSSVLPCGMSNTGAMVTVVVIPDFPGCGTGSRFTSHGCEIIR